MSPATPGTLTPALSQREREKEVAVTREFEDQRINGQGPGSRSAGG
jgi:hypothetical protein